MFGAWRSSSIVGSLVLLNRLQRNRVSHPGPSGPRALPISLFRSEELPPARPPPPQSQRLPAFDSRLALPESRAVAAANRLSTAPTRPASNCQDMQAVPYRRSSRLGHGAPPPARGQAKRTGRRREDRAPPFSPSRRLQPVRFRRRCRAPLCRPGVQIRRAVTHPVAEAVKCRPLAAYPVAVQRPGRQIEISRRAPSCSGTAVILAHDAFLLRYRNTPGALNGTPGARLSLRRIPRPGSVCETRLRTRR